MSREPLRLYRPSNGCEGAAFQDFYCAHCAHDATFRRTQNGADGCPIIVKAMVYDADHPKYPREWRYDAEGYPVCTKFKDVDDGNDSKRRPRPSDPTQLVLIADPTEDAAMLTPEIPVFQEVGA